MTGIDGDARAVAEAVTDPELPMLTLAELGVLRDVHVEDGQAVVSITPTYSGCPALSAIRADLAYALSDAGYHKVDIRTVLEPAWTSDWITDAGRRKLAEAGIAPPGPAPARTAEPVPITLEPPLHHKRCPQCGSAQTERLSEFGSTACKGLSRCRTCREPFEHVKEI